MLKIKVFLDGFEEIEGFFVEIELPFVPQIGTTLFECNFLLRDKAKELKITNEELTGSIEKTFNFHSIFIVKDVWVLPSTKEIRLFLWDGFTKS